MIFDWLDDLISDIDDILFEKKMERLERESERRLERFEREMEIMEQNRIDRLREIESHKREEREREMSKLVSSVVSDMNSLKNYAAEKGFSLDLNLNSINKGSIKNIINKDPRTFLSNALSWEERKKIINISIMKLSDKISMLEKCAENPSLLKEIIRQADEDLSKILTPLSEKFENEEINVANIGKLKAGKSTLFNILAEEEDLFATGRTRKTVVAQKVSKNGISFTDTPGTDCYEEDSAKAFEASEKADILIYVVSALRGSVDEEDRSVIDQVLKKLPENGKGRFVAVVTRIDELKNSEDIELVKNKISSQILSVTGFEVPVFTSSSLGWFENSAKRSTHPAANFKKEITTLLEKVEQNKDLTKKRDAALKIKEVVESYQSEMKKFQKLSSELAEEKRQNREDCLAKLKVILENGKKNLERISNI
ncbi:MAG: GTPase [bacterium]